MKAPPLGTSQSHVLEFKGRQALADPKGIARAVVGMLNADGGVAWIGVTDVADRAGAYEDIPDVESACRRLRDHLIDTIEPSPTADELSVQSVASDDATHLIVVSVPRGKRGPYSQRSGSARSYWLRVNARVREMSREELAEAFRTPRTGDLHDSEARRDAVLRIRTARTSAEQFGQPALWLQIRPVIAARVGEPARRALLTDRALVGDRAHGWAFAVGGATPRMEDDRLVVESGRGSVSWIDERGAVQVHALLDMFAMDRAQVLNSWALIETICSTFRIAGRILAEADAPDDAPVLADFALLGLNRTWRLKPYSPNTVGFSMSEGATFDGESLLRSDPFEFTASAVRDGPDSCALRVVRWLYGNFGFDEEMIPVQFDRTTGRFHVPS